MEPQQAISARGLCKSYGDNVVLDGIDLDVPAGTVYALLGPNGAGKTTVVQILSTLIAADRGAVVVAGHDLARDPDGVRAAIGVTGQFSAVDDLLTGTENLRLMADLCHLPRSDRRRRIAQLLQRLSLVEESDKTASTYSGGMRRRLDLAMTLIGSPRVIFLDEPTTGLDPLSRRDVWDIIRELVADGVTVLLTTQQLEEADALADTVAVLDHGRLVALGTPDQLKRSIPGGHIRLRFTGIDQLDAAVTTLPEGTADPDALTLSVPGDGRLATLRDLINRLDLGSVEVESLTVHTPDLDDVFLTLTGHPAPDAPTTPELEDAR